MKKMIVCSLLTLMCAASLIACGTQNKETTAAPTAVQTVASTTTADNAKQNTQAPTVLQANTQNASNTASKVQPISKPVQQQTQQPHIQQPQQPQKPVTPVKPQNTITIEAANYLRYVTAEDLQVRQQPSAGSASLGALKENAQVQVTGNVLVNGAYTNWVRINFNGRDAYVCSDYLSADPVVPAPTKTGDSLVLYYSNGNSFNVYKYTDEYWRDDNGVIFTQVADSTWATTDGATTVYTYNPNSGTDEHLEEEMCYTVNVNQGYLALRNDCTTDPSNEIGQLQNGDNFYVTDKLANGFWFGHDANGVSGFVNSAYLR